jgi:hypothetical protein
MNIDLGLLITALRDVANRRETDAENAMKYEVSDRSAENARDFRRRYGFLQDLAETLERAVILSPAPTLPSEASLLLDLIDDVERSHFRTGSDSGAQDNALFIWNCVRDKAGLPALSRADLPYHNGHEYAMPHGSRLLAAMRARKEVRDVSYDGRVPCRKCGTAHWMYGDCPPDSSDESPEIAVCPDDLSRLSAKRTAP